MKYVNISNKKTAYSRSNVFNHEDNCESNWHQFFLLLILSNSSHSNTLLEATFSYIL